MLLTALVACGPSRLGADEAEVCVLDEEIHLIFHSCLSSSCSPIRSIACEGTVQGDRLILEGAATIGNPIRNACTDDCQVASCNMGRAPTGVEDVSWGENRSALVDLPPCDGVEGGWGL